MLLGGNYIGQSYIGGLWKRFYVRTPAPLIKSIEPSFKFTSAVYDEVSSYDTTDTYDGMDTVQEGFGNFAVVRDLEFPAPKIHKLKPSYNYTSSLYDEPAPYDDDDTYDGSELVQTQPGNDILFNIEA